MSKREILFRGKRADNGEWVYGSFIPDLMEVYYGDKDLDGFIKPFGKTKEERVMVEVERNTVGQYTGTKDKNNTRIFEHDIISPGGETRLPVCWYDYGWHAKTEYGYESLERDWVNKHFKVIGNIYDNPELLKGDA